MHDWLKLYLELKTRTGFVMCILKAEQKNSFDFIYIYFF